MRIFRFEKWFVDVLTPEREYIVLFHSILEVFGVRICFVEVNISQFGEGPNYHINRKLKGLRRSGHTLSTHQGTIQYEIGSGKIMLLLPGMEIKLNLRPDYPPDFHGKGMKIESSGNGSLEWKPLYLKTAISGSVRIEVEEKLVMAKDQISGKGYVDYLHSSLSPFRVPVRQLYWGRLHSMDVDLTYSYALDDNENLCGSQLIIQSGAETIRLEEFLVHTDQWEVINPPGISCPVSYSIEASSQRLQVSLKVVHLKPAIVSEFAKNPKELGRFRLALLRQLSRDPRGIKFYSTASLELVLDGQTRKLNEVLMIDEYVRII